MTEEERKKYDKIRYQINKDKIRQNSRLYDQTIKGRYSQYKRSSTQKGRSFNLSLKEFETLWQKDCSYCGRSIITIGIDRVDSSVGYQIDNVVSCCTVCNRLKSDFNNGARDRLCRSRVFIIAFPCGVL